MQEVTQNDVKENDENLSKPDNKRIIVAKSENNKFIDKILVKFFEKYPRNNELVNKRIKNEIEYFENHQEILCFLNNLSNEKKILMTSMHFCESLILSTLMKFQLNPLPPHYICDICKHIEFSELPVYNLPDKNCPVCRNPLGINGTDIPFIPEYVKNCFEISIDGSLSIAELQDLISFTEFEITKFEKNIISLNNTIEFIKIWQNVKVKPKELNQYSSSVKNLFSQNFRLNLFWDIIKKSTGKKHKSEIMQYVISNDFISFEEYLKLSCLKHSTLKNTDFTDFLGIEFYSQERIYKYLSEKITDYNLLLDTFRKIKYGKAESITKDIIDIFDEEFIFFIEQIIYLWRESHFYAFDLNLRIYEK
ncbi:hypothetical protein KA977_03985 [Candidatus Dependentiae bacterium]|nr:hypothetical protein [Candidatus Dependentiae bacterium]